MWSQNVPSDVRLCVPTPYTAVGIFSHDGSSLSMREKCPHVVRTWPWVLLYLEMMCFPKERRRRMPSWLPGLSGIGTRSRSPSGWSLHPSICLQSTAAHQLPPNLAEMFLRGQDCFMDQSILMLFMKRDKRHIPAVVCAGSLSPFFH